MLSRICIRNAAVIVLAAAVLCSVPTRAQEDDGTEELLNLLNDAVETYADAVEEEERAERERQEAAARQAEAERRAQERAAAAASAPASSSGGGFSGSCKSASDTQAAEFRGINARKPADAETVAQLQAILYMTESRMALLEKLCRGQPEYAEYEGMRNSRDSTMQTCRQIASSESYCVAQVPW